MFKLIKFIFFIFSFFLIYCNQGADVDKIINHILYISDVTNGYYILEDILYRLMLQNTKTIQNL